MTQPFPDSYQDTGGVLMCVSTVHVSSQNHQPQQIQTCAFHCAGMLSVFISHQWLGNKFPDPSGHQLAVLRKVLRRFIDRSLKVEQDMTRIMSKENPTSYEQIQHGYLFLDWSLRLVWNLFSLNGNFSLLVWTFDDSPVMAAIYNCNCCLVFAMVSRLRFCLPTVRFAIPQITARTDGVNEDATRSDAALAVQSIPAYVEACDLFLGNF